MYRVIIEKSFFGRCEIMIQNTQEDREDLFETIAWLYSEGQLSLEIAITSSNLTREEFLKKYEIYKEKSR